MERDMFLHSAPPTSPDPPLLEARSLSVGYERRRVLDKISFGAARGELIGLIGPNGAGKSTLMKTLGRALTPLSGTAFLEGRPLDAFSAKAFARRVAYLPQRTEPTFSYTVREIVLAGRYPYLSWWQGEGRADREVAEAAMAYTGVRALADATIDQISGGQLQRVLLAKVLAQQTPVLLLDEPATGLDLMYQEELFRFSRALAAAGKTILVVVHELSLAARFCSRLILIGKGRCMADGTPDEVLRPKILSEAYDTDVCVGTHPVTHHYDIYTKVQPPAEEQACLRILLGEEGFHGRW